MQPIKHTVFAQNWSTNSCLTDLHLYLKFLPTNKILFVLEKKWNRWTPVVNHLLYENKTAGPDITKFLAQCWQMYQVG